MDEQINALTSVITPEVAITFALIALANIAIVTAFKHAIARLRTGGVKLLDNPWVGALMELGQPVLGLLLGLTPGVFIDYSPSVRMLLGVVAGFLSPVVYRLIAKRLLPDALTMHGESAVRQEARLDVLAEVADPGEG